MKTERIFSSRNDARVQKFSFWLERSIMKTLPVLCFSSVIEETVYITGSDETNFCDTDKIQQDERCTGREKEKKNRITEQAVFLFFFLFLFSSQLVAPSSEFLEWNRLSNVLLDLDAVTFYIWNATCKIRVQQSRVAVVSIPFLLPRLPLVLFLVERVGYYTIFRSKNTSQRRFLSFVYLRSSSTLDFPVEKWATKNKQKVEDERHAGCAQVRYNKDGEEGGGGMLYGIIMLIH